jgi:hypothetical protein
MTTQTIETDNGTLTVITADNGKVFQRISDSDIVGTQLYLGINELPEDYTEIDPPQEELSDGDYMLNKFGLNENS